MLLSAFIAFAPILGEGDAFMALSAIISWLGQWMKSQKRIPNIVVQGAMLGIGFAFYWHRHPFDGADGWLRDGLMWSSGLPGMASIAGSLGLAPKTDSRGGSTVPPTGGE